MALDAEEQEHRKTGSDGAFEVMKAFTKYLSNLSGAMKQAKKVGYGGLSLSCRGSLRWTAVFRRRYGDFDPEVCFGDGATPWDALMALNAAIGKKAWRHDKFADERYARAKVGV